MKLFIVLISSVLLLSHSFGQEMSHKLNKAIEKDNFRKVERIVKCQIKKHKKGVASETDKGKQISHSETFDWLVAWLKIHPNVEDAAWDRCAVKTLVYPGSSTIGAVFQTRNGDREMCFHVQVGKLGRWNDKHVLAYKKMESCGGFLKTQKQNCRGK